MVGTTLNIALSGIAANARRIDNAANNIANFTTVGAISPENGPSAFTPSDIVQLSQEVGGVSTTQIPRDPAFVPVFAPQSAFADSEGLIAIPNVNLAAEAVDITTASIAYKANVQVIEAAQELSDELLSIFDEEV